VKFRRIAFRNFGPFEDTVLDFAPTDGVQIIFGPNEAGKSSALRGLRAFLFGFPGQNDDNFRFDYKLFRVQALVENKAAQTLECIRRKGNKDTLRKNCDKAIVPDKLLTEFMGGLTAEQFEQLFGLDTVRLQVGGQSIADGEGEVGEALFEAGAGMRDLRALEQKLVKRQADLFKVSGRAQEIPAAHARLRDLTDAMNDATLAPEEYANAAENTRTREEHAASLRTQRVEIRRQLDQLSRYRASLPTITLWQTARANLKAVADAVPLETDFKDRFRRAGEELTGARSEAAVLETAERSVAEDLAAFPPASPILVEEEEIGELKKLVGADQKAADDEGQLRGIIIKERDSARDIYRDLTNSTAWDEMEKLKPTTGQISAIVSLANRHAAVVERMASRREAVEQLKADLEEAIARREACPPAAEVRHCSAVVEDVIAAGPLEEQLQKTNDTLASDEKRLAKEYDKLLPRPVGEWQQAAELALPLAAHVEQFRVELDNAGQREKEIATQLRELGKELKGLRKGLVDAGMGEAVPTPESLHEARADRDQGLQLVRGQLNGVTVDELEEEFIRRHAVGRQLIDAVEKSVGHCDTIADRLRHEADRVLKHQQSVRHIADAETRLQELTGEQSAAKAAINAINARWVTAWLPAGITPESPATMQAWLAKWESFVERAGRLEDVRTNILLLRKLVDTLRGRLHHDCPPSREADTLAGALTLARSAIARETANRLHIDQIEEEVRRLRADTRKADEAASLAAKEHGDWERDWAEAIAVLPLRGKAASVEAVQTYLERIRQMQEHLSQRRIKEATIRKLGDDRDQLLLRINAVRSRLDKACRPTTAATLESEFRELELHWREADRLRTRREELTRQHREISKKLGKTRESLTQAESALQALAIEAGVAIDGIPVAIQRAADRTAAEKEVRQCEEILATHALGEQLERFIENALVHRADLKQQIDELEFRAAQLDPEISAAEQQALDAARVLAGYQSISDAAAEARQQAANQAERLKELMIEYAALHLARKALEKAKEKYRAEHQDTLLSRAGAFFGKLTDGAFAGIDIDNDDGTDVLRAVRSAAGPDALVPVSGLSDGTRDQLFLALRLAGIEEHLREREPMPLIIDDCLVNFDDRRTKATLACLFEFAEKTQVILFTHHQHVVEMAKSLKTDVAVHELSKA